ncbi:hypothetical protein COT07_01500 [Candidatus Woesearchaeota archaeon CG07_land_8_20_14_0_80_44_23]|nr:MAG: hypothetical protein COT07_01500 [Candidatus Woesearchaeota archaeon CG07_land_8_20_14_0_80_44_23]
MKNPIFSIKPLNVLILIAVISSLIFLSSCTSKRPENKVLFPFYAAVGKEFDTIQYATGYMDEEGNVIFKPQFAPGGNPGGNPGEDYYYHICGKCIYDYEKDDERRSLATAEFHENRAVFKNLSNWLYGYIDNTGKVVILPQYAKALPFSDGLAAVIIVNKTADGKPQVGYIDINGNMIIKPNESLVPNPFSEGLCLNVLEVNYSFPVYMNIPYLGYKYGIINKKGEIVVPPKFHAGMPFSEGRAAVFTEGENRTVGWGFIDSTGNIVIPPKYMEVQSFSEGLAAALTVKPFNFSDFSDNSSEIGYYFRRQQWQYIDKNGKVVIEPKVDLALYNISYPLRCPIDLSFGSFHDGRAKFTVTYIDKTYTERCMDNDYQLKHAEDFYIDCEKDPAPFFNRVGYIDKTGKVVIPPKFSDAGDFSEGLAYIRETYPGTYKHFSLYGFINVDGEKVIDYRLRMPADFHNGLAIFETIDYGRHMTLYINKNGTVIIPKYTINASI